MYRIGGKQNKNVFSRASGINHLNLSGEKIKFYHNDNSVPVNLSSYSIIPSGTSVAKVPERRYTI